MNEFSMSSSVKSNRASPSSAKTDLSVLSTYPIYLTPRQLEVLRLLCEGLCNKVICRRLNIAPGTAKVHISSIFRELGVCSRLEAVVTAQRLGLAGGMAISAPGVAANTGACHIGSAASMLAIG